MSLFSSSRCCAINGCLLEIAWLLDGQEMGIENIPSRSRLESGRGTLICGSRGLNFEKLIGVAIWNQGWSGNLRALLRACLAQLLGALAPGGVL